MMLVCDNKGCFASDEHLLDESDDTVYCVQCGKSINYPPTTKYTLRKMKQVKRHVKPGLSFTCKSCKTTDRPVLKQLGGFGGATIATCRDCGKQLDIPAPFIEALKSLTPDPMVDGDIEDEKDF